MLKKSEKAILVNLGKCLRSYREAKGVSQETLSFDAGIHRTYLSQIELGERNPSFTTFINICKALGVSPAEVIAQVVKK